MYGRLVFAILLAATLCTGGVAQDCGRRESSVDPTLQPGPRDNSYQPPPVWNDLYYGYKPPSYDTVPDTLNDPSFKVRPWGTTTSAIATKSARKHFEQGYTAWLKRRYAVAEKAFEAVLQQYPGDARVWELIGQVQLASREIEQAKQSFRKAAGLDDKFVLPLVGLLEIANEAGDSKTALQLSDKIQQMAPVHVQAQDKKGQPFDADAQGSWAYQWFLTSETVRTEAACAMAYLNGGLADRAAELAKTALVISGGSLKATLLYADVALRRQDTAEAAEVLQAFLRGKASKQDKRIAEAKLQQLQR